MPSDVASFPGQADSLNTFAISTLNGAHAIGGYTDVSGFGAVQVMFSADSTLGTYTVILRWSDDGVTNRASDTLTVFGSSLAVNGYASVEAPALAQFVEVDIINNSGVTAVLSAWTFLRPTSIAGLILSGGVWLPQSAPPAREPVHQQRSGWIDGRQVKTAFVDGAAAGDVSIVAAVTGKKIRVLSWQVSNGGTASNIFFINGAGGAQKSLTIRPGTVSTVTATTPDGSFLFETTAGTALYFNASAANAYSVQVQYVEI